MLVLVCGLACGGCDHCPVFVCSFSRSWLVPLLSCFAGNFTVGKYVSAYSVRDSSGNNASCHFYFEVLQFVDQPQPTSDNSQVMAIGGGAGGGLALLALIALLALFLVRRSHKKVGGRVVLFIGLLLLLLLICVDCLCSPPSSLYLHGRNVQYPIIGRTAHSPQQMQAATSGYAELMAMSDEFVLERARVRACPCGWSAVVAPLP